MSEPIEFLWLNTKRWPTVDLEVELEYLQREHGAYRRSAGIAFLEAELARRKTLLPYRRARGLFDADFIIGLKRIAPVEVLIQQTSGVRFKPSGKGLVGRCPFHEDKTPSLHVWPDEERWHCFSGQCSQGGDVFDWVTVDGVHFGVVSFREAVAAVAKWAGVALPESKTVWDR